MGWLGWRAEEALAADVQIILLALEGREDLLKSIFGEAEEKAKPRGPMSAETFKRFAKQHNRRFRGRKN